MHIIVTGDVVSIGSIPARTSEGPFGVIADLIGIAVVGFDGTLVNI